MSLPAYDFTLTLPPWMVEAYTGLQDTFLSVQERMQLILFLAEKNVAHNTGGPFAAGVFEQQSGRLIAMGVNRVVPSGCSSAHAEVVALSLAQKRIGSYDLGGIGMTEHQLVVNWCPCVMCFGAVIWSGIRELVIAGAGPELEEITGFDEGPLPLNWREELKRRGINVLENVLRDEAIAGFRAFAASNQLVYNARQGYPPSSELKRGCYFHDV